MSNSKVQAHINRFDTAMDGIIELARTTSEEVLRWKPSAEEWSMMETLVHVEELCPYWIGELENVLQNPGVQWGRGMNDEARLAAVAKTDDRSLEEVIPKVVEVKQQVDESMAKLNDQDLAVASPHRIPKFGVKDMEFLADHFISGHAEVHYKQMERVLQQYNDSH